MVPMDHDQLPQAGGTPITQVPAAPAAAAPGRSMVSAAWVCCATAVSGVVLWTRNLLAVMALMVCCCRCYCNSSSSSAAAAAATHRQY
ncbi:unnamed protein product [Sphagnum jensenii]